MDFRDIKLAVVVSVVHKKIAMDLRLRTAKFGGTMTIIEDTESRRKGGQDVEGCQYYGRRPN